MEQWEVEEVERSGRVAEEAEEVGARGAGEEEGCPLFIRKGCRSPSYVPII